MLHQIRKMVNIRNSQFKITSMILRLLCLFIAYTNSDWPNYRIDAWIYYEGYVEKCI